MGSSADAGKGKDAGERFNNRKPISEVLHDIYDDKAH